MSKKIFVVVGKVAVSAIAASALLLAVIEPVSAVSSASSPNEFSSEIAAVPSAAALTADARSTDQIIVQYKAGEVPDAAELSRTAGESIKVARRTSSGAYVSKLPGRRTGAQVAAAARRIAQLPQVAFAEPDTRMYPTAAPTDPLYGDQWHYFAPTTATAGTTLVGANLLPAWDITRGRSDAVVAVIDTGITAHADLAGQVLPGYDVISDAQIGNDGNGRDSNPSDNGDWITSTENASGFFAGCGTKNSSWHGTHVAGTVAAVSDNGLGVAGIAPGAKILPI